MHVPLRPFLRYLLLLFPLLLLGSPLALAQEFAPLGATWTHLHGYDGNPNREAVALRYVAERDTVLADRSARVVEGYRLFDDMSREYLGAEVVTGTYDSVYVWIQDSFHLVFDFAATTGDTVTVATEPFAGFFELRSIAFDSFVYRIDSVTTDTLTGGDRIIQYVNYLNPGQDNFNHWGFLNGTEPRSDYSGRILRGVGSLGYESFLGTTARISYIWENAPGALACYRDADHDYRFLGVDCDALIEQRTSLRRVAAFAGSVYPNPVHRTLRIEPPTGTTIGRIELRDVTGRAVASARNFTTLLNVGHLAAGVYQLFLFDGDGGISVARVVKQ